jgi:hypothetical protein
LLLDDHLLEMSHDGLAILDRETDLASRRRFISLSISSSERWTDPNSSVPHRIDALSTKRAPREAKLLNNPLPPQLI